MPRHHPDLRARFVKKCRKLGCGCSCADHSDIAVFEALEREFKVELPTTVGLDTLGCIEAAHAEQLKFGFCLGGNLYGSNPDAAFVAGRSAGWNRLSISTLHSTRATRMGWRARR